MRYIEYVAHDNGSDAYFLIYMWIEFDMACNYNK